MIITIDGPAGSGKSTAARGLAGRLGFAYLDTGAMYRAMTLKALEEGVDLQDEAAVARMAEQTDLRLDCRPEQTRVLLDGRDVTREIRSARVSDHSSCVACVPAVREVLVAKQRQMGRDLGSLVAEGRDQGSVVFPMAEVKFFLDASLETRARRRYAEMKQDRQAVSYESVLAGLQQRDDRDAGRRIAPLIHPGGAIEIDTTDMTIEEVTDRLCEDVMRIAVKGGDQPTAPC